MAAATAFSLVQTQALRDIQDRQHDLKRPGSRQDEAHEFAKDYVINRSHAAVPAYLTHDVLRDGYKEVGRQGHLQGLALASVAADVAPPGMPTIFGDVVQNGYPQRDLDLPRPVFQSGGGGRAGGSAVIDRITPEDMVVGSMMCDELTSQVQDQLGDRGVAVLATLLQGLTIDEAAACLCLATSTVELYRSKIRQLTRSVFLLDAA